MMKNTQESREKDFNMPVLYGKERTEFKKVFKKGKLDSYRKIENHHLFTDGKTHGKGFLYQLVEYVKKNDKNKEFLHYEIEIFSPEDFTFVRSVKLDLDPTFEEGISDEEANKILSQTEYFRERIEQKETKNEFLATDGNTLMFSDENTMYFFSLETGKRYKYIVKAPSSAICGYDTETCLFQYISQRRMHKSIFGFRTFKINGFGSKLLQKHYPQCMNLEICENLKFEGESNNFGDKSFQLKLNQKIEEESKSEDKINHSQNLICHLLNMNCEDSQNKLFELEQLRDSNQNMPFNNRAEVYRGVSSINISIKFFRELTKSLEGCEAFTKKEGFSQDPNLQYNLLCIMNITYTLLKSLSLLNLSLRQLGAENTERDKFRKLVEAIINFGGSQGKGQDQSHSKELNPTPISTQIQQKGQEINRIFIKSMFSSKEDALEELITILEMYKEGEMTDFGIEFIRFLASSKLMQEIAQTEIAQSCFELFSAEICSKLCRELEAITTENTVEPIYFESREKAALEFMRSYFQFRLLYFFQEELREEHISSDPGALIIQEENIEQMLKIYFVLIENSSKIFKVAKEAISKHVNEEEVFKDSASRDLVAFQDKVVYISLQLNKFYTMISTFLAALSEEEVLQKTIGLNILATETLTFIKTVQDFHGKFKLGVKQDSISHKRMQALRYSLEDWTLSLIDISQKFMKIHKTDDKNIGALVQSQILSGGIKSNFVHTFTPKSLEIIQYYCSTIKDQNLLNLINAKNLTDDYEMMLAIIHQGKKPGVDQLIDLLQQDLLQRDITAKVGGNDGMIVSRCAFAANLSLNQYDETCSFVNISMIIDQLDLIKEEIDPNLSEKEKNNELLEELKLSANVQGIIDRWKIANKMRIWLQGKRKDISNKS